MSHYVPYQKICVESERKDMLLLLDFLRLKLVELWTVNPYVAGSSPARGANNHAIFAQRSEVILVLLCLTQTIAHRIVSGICEAGSAPIQDMIKCRVK